MNRTKQETPQATDNGDGGEEPASRMTSAAAGPDDLESIRLTQDFAALAGVKKLIKTIPIRKPSKEWFVRTHPDESYRIQTLVLELKDSADREIYRVARPLWEELANEPTVSPRMLVTTINKQGVLFVWPIRLPGVDGKIDTWNQSALIAAEEAKSKWVRVTGSMNLGGYEIFAESKRPVDPTWPEITFAEIIRTAFQDKVIDSLEHPVLKRLRGEA
jgi:hypothetical protein